MPWDGRDMGLARARMLRQLGPASAPPACFQKNFTSGAKNPCNFLLRLTSAGFMFDEACLMIVATAWRRRNPAAAMQRHPNR